MKKLNIQDAESHGDLCGGIQDLYNSDNLSIAYVTNNGKAKSHMHKKLEEVYYITKGLGKITIGNDTFDIKPGDIIPIPKNTFHHLEKTSEVPVELLVVTYPKFDLNDVIEEE